MVESRGTMKKLIGGLIVFLTLLPLLAACSPEKSCPVTAPVWELAPDDPAVQNEPAYEYFFINEDRSIWASAWWTRPGEASLSQYQDGYKVAWFRPEGADLEITGRRIDTEAPPLEVFLPCCYNTRLQITGLTFPTEGCWEITARAADSELTFTTWVEP